MTSHSKEEIFEAIQDQLQEHKIVTFKWLSRTLKLHSTTAKRYLSEWVEKEPKDKYIVTYTVFGRKENGELLLMLTKETDEDYFKAKNTTVVDRYVFSVQYSDSLFDPTLIYNIDKSTYELQKMSLSSINYHTEIIRKDPKSGRTPLQVNGSVNGSATQNDIRRTSPRKNSGGPSPKKLEPGKNGLPSRISPRKKESETATISSVHTSKDSDKTKPSASKKAKTTKSTAASGSIKNFFGKGPAKKEPMVDPVETEVKKTEIVEIPNNKNNNSKVDEKVSKEPKKEETKNRKSNKKETTKKTKKKGKQMKRIVSSFDSDSDEDSNLSDNNVDDILEPEPEPEPIIVKESESEARVKVIDGKKRKRKVIENCEQDEEGFMHTTKKVIYESCDSDDEPEEEADTKRIQPDPIKAPPEKKAKIEVVTKKKQASILSFFQKPQKSKT